MSSRDKILSAVAANQPRLSPLPDVDFLKGGEINAVEKFTEVLTAVGGKVINIAKLDEVTAYIEMNIAAGERVVNLLSEPLGMRALQTDIKDLPHALANIELAILQAEMGIAENGAVWLNENRLGQRVTPFICQHLVVILDKSNVVPTMHHAYEKIGNEKYGFATFIAGPSKTADIEQSLVLGAHGSRSMTVFLRDI